MAAENTWVETQRGLDITLSNIVGLPKIVFENVADSPTHGTPFIRTNLVTSTSNLSTVAGQQENPGTYVIDIFTPAKKGTQTNNEIADLIKTAFKSIPKGIIFYGFTEIWIEAISKTFSSRDEVWFHGGVDIEYTTFTD